MLSDEQIKAMAESIDRFLLSHLTGRAIPPTVLRVAEIESIIRRHLDAVSESNGASLIATERRRQIEAEGFDATHDDQHTHGELAMAAVCYAAPDRIYAQRTDGFSVAFVDPWPFGPIPGSRYSGDWDRRKHFRHGNYPLWPQEQTTEQRLDLLVKAGALIAAEIDRLQRRERNHA